MNKEDKYESLIEAIHLAIDAEQPEGGPHPYKEETERCLHVVYTLLREALNLPPELEDARFRGFSRTAARGLT